MIHKSVNFALFRIFAKLEHFHNILAHIYSASQIFSPPFYNIHMQSTILQTKFQLDLGTLEGVSGLKTGF